MVQAIFARVRLCERGRRRVAKKPYDLSPKYLCFSLYKRFVVHTCMWLDITGLRFVLSQSVKHFILSRYTSTQTCSLHTYFSLFHLGFLPSTKQFHISLWESNILVSVLQNQFGRIYVLLTCKTFLARFVSFAALSWVYASQIVWNLTKTKKTNKTKKSWSEQVT